MPKVLLFVQEEAEQAKLRLSTVDSQLENLLITAQSHMTGSIIPDELTNSSAASATPAVAATQAVLRELLEGREALESQVQELTTRCNGLGITNEELKCAFIACSWIHSTLFHTSVFCIYVT